MIYTLLCPIISRAQEINWPNPEVENLYKSAQASLSSGDYKKAIASYQQAIPLAPKEMILYRDLASAFYRSGNYTRAEHTITPLIDNDRADAISYALASSIQTALKEDKKARKLLEQGLDKYPHSGYLHHELGKYYEENNDETSALKHWLEGIAADPNYHLNYYDASRSYMLSNKPIWAIIYGEIFVNTERSTPRSGETRKLLLASYKKFFTSTDEVEIQGFGKEVTPKAPADFEEAVSSVLYKLAPVVSDGITVENLTMLRTRFTMDWMAQYGDKYPYSLFSYYDALIREGHFDAYNQWLFGRAANTPEFEAWNNFHPEAIPSYDAWFQLHPLQMTAADAYNTKVSKKLFEDINNQYKR